MARLTKHPARYAVTTQMWAGAVFQPLSGTTMKDISKENSSEFEEYWTLHMLIHSV